MLRVRGVSKRFGTTQALADVDLAVDAGEVHAVLGENGAGKSTLMNVLYGLVRPDAGTVELEGSVVRLRSPLDARRAGIGMVHQEFALVDALSVTENLALCLSPAGTVRLDHHRIAAAATRLAGAVGLEIGELSAPAGSLPVGVRQRIEILKALAGDARLLILDEPTAVLTPGETTYLFRVLERLRGRGIATIFITHKLREALAIADRVTVLRRGRVITTAPRAAATETGLAELMFGAVGEPVHKPGFETAASRPPQRERGSSYAGSDWGERPATGRSPRLRVDHLTVDDLAGNPALMDITFAIAAGELLGIAGVDGNGQTELFEALAGLRPLRHGSIAIDGQPLTAHTPAASISAGIGFIPPDRGRQGLIPAMSVQDNALLNRESLRRIADGPFLRPARMRAAAAALVARYAIRTASTDTAAANLSGGNQQRLVVARTLALEPKVLVAFNPTRGLDIAAARAVREAIDAALAQGTAVLLISTDLDEVIEMSQRVLVLFRGRAGAPLSPPFSPSHLGRLMTGTSELAESASPA